MTLKWEIQMNTSYSFSLLIIHYFRLSQSTLYTIPSVPPSPFLDTDGLGRVWRGVIERDGVWWGWSCWPVQGRECLVSTCRGSCRYEGLFGSLSVLPDHCLCRQVSWYPGLKAMSGGWSWFCTVMTMLRGAYEYVKEIWVFLYYFFILCIAC